MLLRTEILTENCSWVPLFAEHFCQKKTVPSYLKFLNERGRETAVSGSSRKRTRSVHEKGVRNWSWLLTTRPILQQNGNVTDDGPRKSNNWFDGLTNRRATNLAPEVVFSPFRALSVVN